MENPENQHTEEKGASDHKTKIELSVVESFLESHYKTSVTNLEAISGGEGSQAFSFEANGEALILRVSQHSGNGFKKDAYAYEQFHSEIIPIPEILELGEMADGKYFAISKKVEGSVVKNLSKEELVEALPSMFATLEAIHATDVSDRDGYGKWNSDGVASKESWKEVLLNVDEFAVHIFDTSMLEKDVWDKIHKRFIELIQFCPEEKYLVHADYSIDNVLTKDGKVTGVIDWESSMYGDFLHDIAWMQFFSKGFDYEQAYLEYCKANGKEIEHYKERILCYQLYIGLGSLSFYAYSKQEDKYERSKRKMLELIETS